MDETSCRFLWYFPRLCNRLMRIFALIKFLYLIKPHFLMASPVIVDMDYWRYPILLSIKQTALGEYSEAPDIISMTSFWILGRDGSTSFWSLYWSHVDCRVLYHRLMFNASRSSLPGCSIALFKDDQNCISCR